MAIWHLLFTPNDRGVGTGNLAVERNQTPPINSMYNRAYNVRGCLAATASGAVKFTQSVPIVPIEGNGLYLAGQMALQGLIDLENQKKGAAK